jgi:phosphate transport system permease protein
MSSSAATAPGRPSFDGGSLPNWAPYAVVAASAVAVAAVLAVMGGFKVALMLVLSVVVALIALYVWARAVEGSRQATNRVVTLGIVAAFALAIAPLISLLYQVIERGIHRVDSAFFTESARNVIGEGGGASALS